MQTHPSRQAKKAGCDPEKISLTDCLVCAVKAFITLARIKAEEIWRSKTSSVGESFLRQWDKEVGGKK